MINRNIAIGIGILILILLAILCFSTMTGNVVTGSATIIKQNYFKMTNFGNDSKVNSTEVNYNENDSGSG